MTERLLLIDGHSMAFRAFYGLRATNFSTKSGQYTNAVYGFLSMFTALLREEKPTKIAVAFDVGRQTFRTEIFPDYKAQRKPTPEEFRGQVEIIRELLEAMGVTTLSVENYEADDILATLATAASGKYETLIVTGDRDYFQLVNDTTTVLYPVRGVSELARFTPSALQEKYELSPSQYPDFAALRGDPSDNLPGIPGVGEKTAHKWIVKYGDLDTLIEHAAEIKGKVGENFRARIEQVRLNRKLTQMVLDLELPVGPADLDIRIADAQSINKQMDRLEFGNQLRGRIFNVVRLGTEDQDLKVDSTPDIMPSLTLHDAGVSWLGELPVNTVTGLALDVGKQQLAVVIPGLEGVVLDLAELDAAESAVVAAWLADPGQPKSVHGAKALSRQLRAQGYELAGVQHDTLLAAYLLRPDQRSYELEELYRRYLERGLRLPQQEADDNYGVPVDKQAAAALELSKALVVHLQDAALYELYRDLELPLAAILGRMEDHGIAVNRVILEEQLAAFEQQVADEQTAARELAGDPTLSLTSPQQLQRVLFDTFGLPKTKKTKTGYSTAAAELEALAVSHPHPFLDHLLAHREAQKMKTTLEGLLKTVDSDGRIHTTFRQTATTTGRLSSTDPNLQNIPVRTAAGRKIRSAFEVGEGFETLLTADYSQIEMRVMAHLSGDEGLIEAYQDGEDLHNYVGSKVFNVPLDGVTPEIRRQVKAMSYGLAYGLSAFGLSKQLNIPAGQAKRIMDSYFERFGGVKRYLEQVVEEARSVGYTETLFGRRRYLPDLNASNRMARANAERAALNAPIQGTAAEIIKVAMLRVDHELRERRLRSRVLLQVHDELVVEVAPGELEEVRSIISTQMDSAITLRVPLEVSVGVGSNWDAAAH